MTVLDLDYVVARSRLSAVTPAPSDEKKQGRKQQKPKAKGKPQREPAENGEGPSALKFRSEGITEISADLAPLASTLRKLELPSNDLSSGRPLLGLGVLSRLTYLDLSGNKLNDLAGVQACENLTVLNVSHNTLKDIFPHVLSCKKLKALVANDNQITTAKHISKLTELNTIILSHNKLAELPPLRGLKQLKKIAVAHNALAKFPDLQDCGNNLHELRLNHNLITSIPESIPEVAPNLEILDMGSNHIKNWIDIIPLGSMQKIINLTSKGNAICNREKYREMVVQLIPSLRILDGERFDPRYQERKANQKARQELIRRIEQQKAELEARKSAKPKRKRDRADGDGQEAQGKRVRGNGRGKLAESAHPAPRERDRRGTKREDEVVLGDQEAVPRKKLKGVAASDNAVNQRRDAKLPREKGSAFSQTPARAAPRSAATVPAAAAEVAAALGAARAAAPMGFKKAKREVKRLAQMAIAAGIGAEAAPTLAELMGKVDGV